jgi:hypothetical protein
VRAAQSTDQKVGGSSPSERATVSPGQRHHALSPGTSSSSGRILAASASPGIVALVFQCKVTGGHLTTNNEVTAFRWASQSDAGCLMAEAYAVRVLDALRFDPTASVRAHDGTRVIPEP